MTVFTIGVDGLTEDSLIRKLKANKIERVFDIRRRRDTSLEFLANFGIKYTWVNGIGVPEKLEKMFANDRDRMMAEYKIFFYRSTRERFIDYISTKATKRPCAILGFDRVAKNCARSIIAAELHMDVIDL